MKSGVSPQKLQKYRWQTPIWTSICTPVAPSLLISSEHSPRLGGHNFRLGGTSTSSHLGGTAPECPPWRRPGLELWQTSQQRKNRLIHTHYKMANLVCFNVKKCFIFAKNIIYSLYCIARDTITPKTYKKLF